MRIPTQDVILKYNKKLNLKDKRFTKSPYFK